VAAVDATSGAVVPGFVPSGANNTVYALALSDGTLYLGGIFSSMDGSQRRGAAAIDAETGSIETWNPDPQFAVAALAVSGTTLYAGGAFSFMDSTARNGLAAFDTSTGNLTSWDPDAGNEVLALDASGSTVYAGGIFSSVNMEPRAYLAAINDSTGVATSWDPEPNGQVLALSEDGSHLFAGGNFSQIGGQARQYVAELDEVTGAAETSWNADVQIPLGGGGVNAIIATGSTTYIGGQFTNVDGQTRNNIAELDSTGAPVNGWNANANDIVSALAIFGPTLYVGGSFSQVGGQIRHEIAAVDAGTGSLLSWDPEANNTVDAVAAGPSGIYVGGDFTSVGGQTRHFLASLDPSTGLATSWNPSPDGAVQAIAENGPSVFVGGQFSSIGGQDRSYLATIDATTGNATSFDPEPNSVVEAITGVSNTLDVGGAFTGFELGASQGYASFGLVPPDTLTVGRAGAGSGTVSSSPDGITCGTTCSADFDDGSTVTLTATAGAGSTFSGWSGGGCTGTGTCDVTLAGDTTVVATFTSGTFSPPTVTGFNPGSGGIHATVTVTGTNFTGATAVKLGGVSAAFTVVDSTHLTFTVPTGAPPSGQIAVTNPGGTGTSSGSFSVTAPPSITSLNPTSGTVGTTVTITGTNLGGTVAVQIGSLITVPTSVDPTHVVFTVPPGAVTGLVKVLGPGGSAASPGVFTVL
jgi:predicted small secreted protein